MLLGNGDMLFIPPGKSEPLRPLMCNQHRGRSAKIDSQRKIVVAQGSAISHERIDKT